MQVVINGEERELPEASTVLDMLSRFKLDHKILVVELNRSIIDRGNYGGAVLHEGDSVEIVHFVGGGSEK